MKRRDFLRQTSLAVAGFASLSGLLGPAQAGVLPPDPFYGNTFPDLDDKAIGLDQYLGKPLVLNFWATWCPPCIKEMPDLEALHQKHSHVQFVGLAVDTAVNVRKFGDKVQVSYPLLIAGHGGIKLMRDLGNKNGGLPFTVVFNKDGRISQQILGQVKPKELERFIGEIA